MSIPYEQTGRTRQKARTRNALVAAARQLMSSGTTPTVEQAADAADIARATAYRYFPNQRALLVATYPEIAAPSLLHGPGPTDPLERLDAVAESITRQIVEHEPELRAMLHLSLAPDPPERGELPLRQGRRIAWVADALAPLRGELPPRELDLLVKSIAAVLGVEVLVWYTDIAGLTRPQAVKLMRRSARALLQAALLERDAERPSGARPHIAGRADATS
jgi:AcrR family transcriptional regulator